jgi:hypothetical protein
MKQKMTKQELIDEILDQFDFEKVHLTMKALGWEWMDVGVPEAPNLRKSARRLLQEATKSPSPYSKISSGGFVVEKDVDGFLELRFEVSSWNTFDSFDDVEVTE